MTDPTQNDRPEPPPWQLTLAHGDRLEVQPSAESTDTEPRIVLTLRPYRAAELGTVLDPVVE